MNNDDLIQALLEEGIEPSEDEQAKLDGQITELTEFLIDYWAFQRRHREKNDQQDLSEMTNPELTSNK